MSLKERMMCSSLLFFLLSFLSFNIASNSSIPTVIQELCLAQEIQGLLMKSHWTEGSHISVGRHVYTEIKGSHPGRWNPGLWSYALWMASRLLSLGLSILFWEIDIIIIGSTQRVASNICKLQRKCLAYNNYLVSFQWIKKKL